MPVAKLNKSSIDKMQFTGSPVDYYDTDLKGFGIRVGQESKSFFARKEVNGKPVRHTIGKLGTWTPDQAREEAKTKLRQMDLGIDPREEAKRLKEASLTLEDAFADYLAHRTLKPTTKKTLGFSHDIYLATWLKLPLGGIGKAEVLSLHRKITTEAGPAAANQAMVHFRAIWNYAYAHQDQPPAPPTRILTATKTWNPNKRRSDRLAPTRFPEFFVALRQFRQVMNDAYTLAVHTGMRSEEVTGLLWANVDFMEETFTAKDTKNGTDLTLPMSPQVKTLLERRRGLADGSVYVFKGQGRGGNVKLAAKRLKDLGFEELTVHGLRRTFRSICESLAIPTATIKALMNHSLSADITDSYLYVSVDELRPYAIRISYEIERLVSDSDNKNYLNQQPE